MVKMIGRIFVLIIALVALAGCLSEPAQLQQGSDPRLAGANAQATQQMASAQLQATQAAAAELAHQATQQAARATEASGYATQVAEATQMAWEVQVTRQAVATRAALEYEGTAQAMAIQGTQAAGSMQATSTAQAYQTQRLQLALERESTVNTVRAVFWYLVATITLFVFAYWAIQRSSFHQIRRKANGESDYVIMGGQLISPELAPGPITRLDGTQAMSYEAAERIKRQQQLIEALRAIASSGTQSQNLLQALGWELPAGEPNVEVIDPRSLGPILDEVEQKLLERPE